MDRNVVSASVLIAIIMAVWLWWLGPTPPAQPTNQENPVLDTTAAQARPDVLPDEEEQDDLPTFVMDSTVTGATQGEARLITVRTDLYTAVFSTRGATPVSFVLNEYRKFDQETPVQMIDTTGAGALALVFTSPRSHLYDTRQFVFETNAPDGEVVVGDEPVELVFETQVGAGAIRQVYTFQPGEYEMLLRVEQENAASFSTNEGYELVWNGGIPFTEGDPENEALASGAYGRSGGEIESITLQDEAEAVQRLSGAVDWVAVKNKYFTAVMIPERETRGAELIGERRGEVGTPVLWEDYSARLLMPPAAEADLYRLYIGPMEFYRVTDYSLGLYGMVDYGYDFLEWITRPLAQFIFIPVFTFLSSFIPNYGLVIIVFAVLLKLVLAPLTKSSFRNMARMRELQPKMEAIKEKYGDNPQKQQEAMMKMYRETGVNPIGGCLPMLLQWPVIIALWQFLPSSLEIRQESFLWAHDLSAPDVILALPFTIPLYGNFVAGFTLLMGLSMVVQMRLQQAPTTNPQAKMLTYLLPFMLFFFFNRLAAGLSLYYLCYNILSAAHQKLINRQIEREQKAPVDTDVRKRRTGGKGKASRTGRSKKLRT